MCQYLTSCHNPDHHLAANTLVCRCSSDSGPGTGTRIIYVFKIRSRTGSSGLSLFLHWEHIAIHRFSPGLSIQAAHSFGKAPSIKTLCLAGKLLNWSWCVGWLLRKSGWCNCLWKRVWAAAYHLFEELQPNLAKKFLGKKKGMNKKEKTKKKERKNRKVCISFTKRGS